MPAEYRYAPYGTVRHIVKPQSSRFGENYLRMLCGLTGWESGWRGTGSQDEYEHVAALPLCKNCENFNKRLEVIRQWLNSK